MAGVNFTGAKYFSINGGNFSEVKGNMNTYHINGGGSMNPAQAFAQLPGDQEGRREKKARVRQHYQQGLLPSASIRPVSESGSSSSSGSSTTSSTRYQSAASWSPTSTAPSPLRGPVSNGAPSSSHRPSSTMNTPPVSTYHSPARSNSSLGSDVSGLEDDFSTPSRSSTPETSADEAYQGTSIPPEQSLDQLSPLTNTLGLSRFTPANQFQPLALPSEIATPQARRSEIPLRRVESRASTYQPPQTTPLSANPPPPVPPRPAGFDAPRARELGPPPPIPPRPTITSPPQSYTTPAPATPQALPSLTPALSDIEDPSVRFARLQAQRQTKGYSSGLRSPLNPPQIPRMDANPNPNLDQLQQTFTQRNDLQIYPSTPSSTIQSPTSPPPIPLRALPSTSSTSAHSALGSPDPNNAPPLDQGQRGWISDWANTVRPERVEHSEAYSAPIGGGFVIRPAGYHQPPPYFQGYAPPPQFMHGPPMNPQISQQWGPTPHQHQHYLQHHQQQQHYQNDYQNYRDQDRGYADPPFRFPF